MTLKRSKPVCVGQTGSGNSKAVAAFIPENTLPLPAVQAAFLASRFGLDGVRAQLTAELAWGRR